MCEMRRNGAAIHKSDERSMAGTACDCEYAERLRQKEETKLKEWRKRLAEACERLGITEDIVWEEGDRVGHPL